MIDKNADGMLQADDLVALYAEDLGKMRNEATKSVTLFPPTNKA